MDIQEPLFKQLQVTIYKLQITNYKLQITNYKLQITKTEYEVERKGFKFEEFISRIQHSNLRQYAPELISFWCQVKEN